VASSGIVTLTVTANDNNGGSVSDSFIVRINRAPVVANGLDDLQFGGNFGSDGISLACVFSDADGDLLSFTAISSNISIIIVSLTNQTLNLSEVDPIGTSTITATATDPFGESVTESFAVNILLGLINNKLVKGILLYPNPTSLGSIHLQFEIIIREMLL
jgi:hypothetical protein